MRLAAGLPGLGMALSGFRSFVMRSPMGLLDRVTLRHERTEDAQAIRRLTEAAFKAAAHSSGTEGAIIAALREAGALALSLVATLDDAVVGHVAFSPVAIDGHQLNWFGLGPVSVRPDLQRSGIGGALIRDGLARLRQAGARGCVVLGDPGYYRRFGFANDPGLRYAGAPAEYFMALQFTPASLGGTITYHRAFDGPHTATT
jgi:putative acetyltransferase